ncbi:MAG: hypothetical protein AAF226_14925 [Verrucomicrobiota bacterium]
MKKAIGISALFVVAVGLVWFFKPTGEITHVSSTAPRPFAFDAYHKRFSSSPEVFPSLSSFGSYQFEMEQGEPKDDGTPTTEVKLSYPDRNFDQSDFYRCFSEIKKTVPHRVPLPDGGELVLSAYGIGARNHPTIQEEVWYSAETGEVLESEEWPERVRRKTRWYQTEGIPYLLLCFDTTENSLINVVTLDVVVENTFISNTSRYNFDDDRSGCVFVVPIKQWHRSGFLVRLAIACGTPQYLKVDSQVGSASSARIESPSGSETIAEVRVEEVLDGEWDYNRSSWSDIQTCKYFFKEEAEGQTVLFTVWPRVRANQMSMGHRSLNVISHYITEGAEPQKSGQDILFLPELRYASFRIPGFEQIPEQVNLVDVVLPELTVRSSELGEFVEASLGLDLPYYSGGGGEHTLPAGSTLMDWYRLWEVESKTKHQLNRKTYEVTPHKDLMERIREWWQTKALSWP